MGARLRDNFISPLLVNNKPKLQYDKTIEYIEKALAINKKFVREGHPSTKTFIENIQLIKKENR